MNNFNKTYEKIMETASAMSSEYYFISPGGKAIPGREGIHINTILKYPGKFGLTDAGIDKVFKKHKETRDTEGYARNEIFLELLKKGWVRVRYYPRNGLILFQIQRMGRKTRENIWSFLEQTLSKKIKFPREYISNVDIRIINTDGDILFFGEIDEVMKKLYESTYKKVKNMLVEAYNFKFVGKIYK